MPIFEWDDSLSIGNEKIDSQHRELIAKIDLLAEAILRREGRNKIGRVLSFMREYGELHFASEEELMDRYGYPGTEEHKRQHARFHETTKRLTGQLESDAEMDFLASTVERFLIDWLILHIKTADRELGEFLKGKI
ncbi:MAG: hemerythrin family protein [Thermoplasmata archaeon]|nr:MAG: hemerythrin family protein [Thermoplasmata archaeon]